MIMGKGLLPSPRRLLMLVGAVLVCCVGGVVVTGGILKWATKQELKVFEGWGTNGKTVVVEMNAAYGTIIHPDWKVVLPEGETTALSLARRDGQVRQVFFETAQAATAVSASEIMTQDTQPLIDSGRWILLGSRVEGDFAIHDFFAKSDPDPCPSLAVRIVEQEGAGALILRTLILRADPDTTFTLNQLALYTLQPLPVGK
jgi:hypothetical protein